jgi:hypothetical protein
MRAFFFHLRKCRPVEKSELLGYARHAQIPGARSPWKSCIVAANTCACLVWNLTYIILLLPRNLRWLLGFWKMWRPWLTQLFTWRSRTPLFWDETPRHWIIGSWRHNFHLKNRVTAAYLRGSTQPHRRQKPQDLRAWRLFITVNVTCITFKLLTALDNTFIMEDPSLLEF